jgi:DNA-binding LacI/PurR family transcriptional regulator
MALELLTHAEQVAAHLKGEILDGRWVGTLPGIRKLGRELGVNPNTVEAALTLLEGEGLLASQSHGKPRRILPRQGKAFTRRIRIGVLPYERGGQSLPINQVPLAGLNESRFDLKIATKSLTELRMSPDRVARLVKGEPMDAWVVISASKEVLEWFSCQAVPTFSLYGPFVGLPVSGGGPRKDPALKEVLRRLVELGHRRIVLFTRKERRHPTPAVYEQIFLSELERLGVPCGRYNLPDWDETPEGFRSALRALFEYTPPTALILEEPLLFYATYQFLARRGVSSPEQISLVSGDPELAFDWCDPPISHIRWEIGPLVRRIRQWATNISCGREDHKQALFDAKFVEGGTIGPVAKTLRQ